LLPYIYVPAPCPIYIYPFVGTLIDLFPPLEGARLVVHFVRTRRDRNNIDSLRMDRLGLMNIVHRD